jgi:hypothetical protein
MGLLPEGGMASFHFKLTKSAVHLGMSVQRRCAVARTNQGDDARHVAEVGGVREYQYRGQRIVIQDAGEARRGDDVRTAADVTAAERQPKLTINGREVPIERTEGGYLSHDLMFKEYGTLDEMAEDLIRQWGSAKIEHGEHEHGEHPPRK